MKHYIQLSNNKLEVNIKDRPDIVIDASGLYWHIKETKSIGDGDWLHIYQLCNAPLVLDKV